MHWIVVLSGLSLLDLGGFLHGHPPCELSEARNSPPLGFYRIGVGMPRGKVESRLGPPDYSPIEGQVYVQTGDGCHVEGVGVEAVCGFVIDYRIFKADQEAPMLSNAVQHCWWGGIGE